MRHLLIILIIALPLAADCFDNLVGFASLAADFNEGTKDWTDVDSFVDNDYLVYDANTGPPVAVDSNEYVLRGSCCSIPLTATDANATLTYRVLSLPENGNLYDPNGQTGDANCSDPNIIAITSVPYTLINNANDVLYWSNPDYEGETHFTFDANDGGSAPCGGASNFPGMVTITNNALPRVSDSNATATTYETTAITLSAVDNGLPDWPGRLNYIVKSLPDNGTLQDPASGAGVIDSNDLPYTLSSHGYVVWYLPSDDNDANTSFTWCANDGGTAPSGGDSDTATVSITVDAHSKDYISFTGRGYITIDDNDAWDYSDANQSGYAFWIRTRDVYGGIVDKYDSDSNGLEISLSRGYLDVDVYGQSDSYNYFCDSYVYESEFYDSRINDGQWHLIYFSAEPNDANGHTEITFYFDNQSYHWFDWQHSEPLNNDANLVIGFNARGLRCDIDRFCIYKNRGDVGWDVANMDFSGRTGTSYSFGSPPDAEWRFSETSGDTATDTIAGYTAILSDVNDVNLAPLNYDYYNTATQQYHYRRR